MFKRHTYPPPSADEARRRVEEFHNITPEQIDMLRLTCQRCLHDVNGKTYDAPLVEDALSHALAAAHEHYDGRIPVKNYILTIAKYYAIVESKCHDRGHAVQFADLARLGEEDSPSLIEKIPDRTDYFRHVEQDNIMEWTKKVQDALREEENDKSLSKGARVKARRARVILAMLKQSVEKDDGIAVDDLQRQEMEQTLTLAIREGDDGFYFCTRCNRGHHQDQLGFGKNHLQYAASGTFESKRGDGISTKTVQATLTYLRRKIQALLPLEQQTLLSR